MAEPVSTINGIKDFLTEVIALQGQALEWFIALWTLSILS